MARCCAERAVLGSQVSATPIHVVILSGAGTSRREVPAQSKAHYTLFVGKDASEILQPVVCPFILEVITIQDRWLRPPPAADESQGYYSLDGLFLVRNT